MCALKKEKGRIPYSVSNFRALKEEGLFYVDKTMYLEKLENLSKKYVVFLRPRRFGKSLFSSMLLNYYDRNNAGNFDGIFGDTYVGKNPTVEANSYYVLKFNFSGLSSESSERLEKSFLLKTRGYLRNFVERYNLDVELNFDASDASDVLADFFDQIEDKLDGKIYVIIDEYDHFANNFLHNKELFREITGKGGFVRSWYEVLKEYTESVIGRMFITGVSPITLDSLTSGFNIVTNVTRNADFNEMMGFNLDEVEELVKAVGVPESENAIDIMRENYNGYLFDEEATNRVYNSNLVLYYLADYEDFGKAPREIIDSNIRSDYRRLAAMFDLYENDEKKEKIIVDIMTGKALATEILSIFELGFEFDRRHFLSLLYYLGLLTVDKVDEFGALQVRVPNLVIKDVYSEYYHNYLKNMGEIRLDDDDVEEAVKELARYNNIEPLIQIMSKYLSGLSNRDYRWINETTIKLLFARSLSLLNVYNVKTEYETGGKFVDLALFSNLDFASSVIIEFKYIKKSDYSEKLFEKLKVDAINQIKDYAQTEEMRNIEDLRKYVVIFSYNECVYFDEIV